MVTHGEEHVFGGQPRQCICTNALRSLSATAEFLVVHVPVFQLVLSICYRSLQNVQRDTRSHQIGLAIVFRDRVKV